MSSFSAYQDIIHSPSSLPSSSLPPSLSVATPYVINKCNIHLEPLCYTAALRYITPDACVMMAQIKNKVTKYTEPLTVSAVSTQEFISHTSTKQR